MNDYECVYPPSIIHVNVTTEDLVVHPLPQECIAIATKLMMRLHS